jgi:hypothetical protein
VREGRDRREGKGKGKKVEEGNSPSIRERMLYLLVIGMLVSSL